MCSSGVPPSVVGRPYGRAMPRFRSRARRAAASTILYDVAQVVRPRRSPRGCDLRVPSPRSMDPDEDDDFARTFAEACEE